MPTARHPPQTRKHNLPRCWSGVLAEQVQGLIHHHRVVLPHDAEGAELAVGDGVHSVGALGLGRGPSFCGKSEQAVAIDGA